MVRGAGFRQGQADGRVRQAPLGDWEAAKAEWAAHWKTKTRDEWAALLGGVQAARVGVGGRLFGGGNDLAR